MTMSADDRPPKRRAEDHDLVEPAAKRWNSTIERLVELPAMKEKSTIERVDDLPVEIRKLIYTQLLIAKEHEVVKLTQLIVDADTGIISEHAAEGRTAPRMLYPVHKNTYGHISSEIASRADRLAEFISEEVRNSTYVFEDADALESFTTFMRLICDFTASRLHFSVRLLVFKASDHDYLEDWLPGPAPYGRRQQTRGHLQKLIDAVQLLPGTCDTQLYFYRPWLNFLELNAITEPLRGLRNGHLTVQMVRDAWRDIPDREDLQAMMIAAVQGIQLKMQTEMTRERGMALMMFGCRGVGGVQRANRSHDSRVLSKQSELLSLKPGAGPPHAVSTSLTSWLAQNRPG